MIQRDTYENKTCAKARAVRASIMSAAVAATVTYFLYGTEKGVRARKQLVKAAHVAKDKALEMKGRAAQAGGDLTETGREIYEEMAHLFKEKQEQLKELDSKDIAGLVKRLHDRWEETKEDIEETLGDAA